MKRLLLKCKSRYFHKKTGFIVGFTPENEIFLEHGLEGLGALASVERAEQHSGPHHELEQKLQRVRRLFEQ